MKVHSQLPVDQYLSAMKAQMSGFCEFGCERFVGTIMGHLFSITYCSGHEMNRRITNEKSRAIGFVRSAGDGTDVYCIRLKGMSNPVSMLLNFALFYLMFALSGDYTFDYISIWPFALAGSLMMAIITSVTDSITERGQEGSRIMTSFLHDPDDYYANINKY